MQVHCMGKPFMVVIELTLTKVPALHAVQSTSVKGTMGLYWQAIKAKQGASWSKPPKVGDDAVDRCRRPWRRWRRRVVVVGEVGLLPGESEVGDAGDSSGGVRGMAAPKWHSGPRGPFCSSVSAALFDSRCITQCT